jgi:hypothetical protein
MHIGAAAVPTCMFVKLLLFEKMPPIPTTPTIDEQIEVTSSYTDTSTTEGGGNDGYLVS